MSDNIAAQINDKVAYAWGTPHGLGTMWAMVACDLIQQPVQAVVEEDVLDGTLAANHRAVVLAGLRHLDAKVTAALEQYAAEGGVVLMTDCTTPIKGAVELGAKYETPNAEKIETLEKEMKTAAKEQAKAMGEELGRLKSIGAIVRGAEKLAAAIKGALDKAEIRPVFETDQKMVLASAHDTGDIRYIFATNASYDYEKDRWNQITSADANIKLPAEGRTVYDAIVGGVARELKDGAGKVRFGPGQMKVWAMTRAPIGGVKLGAARMTRDFTSKGDLIQVQASAALLDANGALLGGDAPMRVVVIDPLGQVRHEVYRAAKGGVLNVALPLAANDPAGQWTLEVHDLLAKTSDKRTFAYAPARTCSAIAGATRRAVYFAEDWENMFRFARTNREVTVVYGTSGFDKPAAERIAKVLGPWDVKCNVVAATEVSKPRPLSEEEARTWIGWEGGTRKPADANTKTAGFDLPGHAILVGTPEDNVLIKQLRDGAFLPYAPGKEFPGPGNGYLAWQRDGVGLGRESITVIAYNEAGMSEAVGTLYEAVQGMDALTRYALPASSTVVSATKSTRPAQLKIAWEAAVADRVVAINGGEKIEALSEDGTWSTIGAEGEVTGTRAAGEGEVAETGAVKPDAGALATAAKVETADRMLKLAVSYGTGQAIAYWGGTLKVTDGEGKVIGQMQLPDDIGAMAVSGDKLIIGTSDGEVYGIGR